MQSFFFLDGQSAGELVIITWSSVDFALPLECLVMESGGESVSAAW